MPTERLQLVPFLAELNPSDFAALATLFAVREFRDGDRLVSEGEPVTALHVVLRGTVHVRRKANRREVLLARLGPGAFFGEINLFDPGLATASVVGLGTGEVATIGHGTLRAFMADHTDAGYRICAALLGELSRRMRQTNQRLVTAVYWASGGPGEPPRD
jgi:CRP-like cAMP-binding protein